VSHDWYCRCARCYQDELVDLTITGAIDEPKSPAEEREERLQEHQARVVLPALDGWGK